MGKLKKVLLFGAPFALFPLLLLQKNLDDRQISHLSIDRESALRYAHQFAADQGIDARDWSPIVVPKPNATLEEYFVQEPEAMQTRIRELVSALPVDVVLSRQDGQDWLRVILGPDGRVLGWERSRNFRDVKAKPVDPAESARLAEKAIRDTIPPGLHIDLGEPEVQTLEGSLDPGARRFIWRANLPAMPGINVNFRAEVEGGKIRQRTAVPDFEEAAGLELRPGPGPGPGGPGIGPDDRGPGMGQGGPGRRQGRRGGRGKNLPSPRSPVRLQLANLPRMGLLLLVAIYGCYRYARRAIEKEVPRARMIGLALFLTFFGVVLYIVDPDLARSSLPPERLAEGFGVFVAFVFIGWLFIQGLLLGLSYGAAEGEIREGFPGKMTSLDAVITGRIFSQNAGLAVLTGASVAVWLALVHKTVLVATHEVVLPSQLSQLATSLGARPWLVLLLDLPVISILSAVTGLMIPLTFLRRNIRQRWLTWVLLLIAAFLLGSPATPFRIDSAASLSHHACIAAALLIAFFANDLLSAMVACMVFAFVTTVPDLMAVADFWKSGARVLGLVAGTTFLGFVWAAWKGRDIPEADVRPQYARNLLQRLSMQAELSAAREAQLRLLPDAPPKVRGLSLAANCTPASEVNGDYYDFFSLPGGLVGIAVAEGGNDGLASALTIALAKGVLLCETSRPQSAAEVVANLEEMLGQLLVRSSGRTSLVYGILDPHHLTLEVARTSDYPRIAVLHHDGSVNHVEQDRVTLERGDSLLIYTDGVPRRLDSQGAGTVEQVLVRMGAFGSAGSAIELQHAVAKLLLPRGEESKLELTDDLTMVVVHIDAAAVRALEEVA